MCHFSRTSHCFCFALFFFVVSLARFLSNTIANSSFFVLSFVSFSVHTCTQEFEFQSKRLINIDWSAEANLSPSLSIFLLLWAREIEIQSRKTKFKAILWCATRVRVCAASNSLINSKWIVLYFVCWVDTIIIWFRSWCAEVRYGPFLFR